MQSPEGWDPHLASQECGAVLGLRVATASMRRGFAPQARTCASIPMPICWKVHLGIGNGMPPRQEGCGRQNVSKGESRNVDCDSQWGLPRAGSKRVAAATPTLKWHDNTQDGS